MVPAEASRPSIEIVSHRGAGADDGESGALLAGSPAAPENTLPAFEWGWRQGASCELDLRLTRDGELLVIHDATTGRTCDRDLSVADHDLAELRRLVVGTGGEAIGGPRLPALSEVFEIMPPGARLWLELKDGPGMVEPLVRAVEGSGLAADQLMFLSFNIESVGEVKRALPEHSCYLVVRFAQTEGGRWRARYRVTDPEDGRGLRSLRVWTRSGASAGEEGLYDELLGLVSAPFGGSDPESLDGLDVSVRQPEGFAAAMRELGVAWGCWTVDEVEIALEMARRGAFQLTTNRPGAIRSGLASEPDRSWRVLEV